LAGCVFEVADFRKLIPRIQTPVALHRPACGAQLLFPAETIQEGFAMPFKRRVNKQTDTPVTPAMVELFEGMKRCADGGERWWELHGELWQLFNAALSPRPRPWQWPVVQSPREAQAQGERPEALELWHALDIASREARAQRNGGGLPPAA
jgi:hypothetical protein